MSHFSSLLALLQARASGGCSELIIWILHLHESADLRLPATALASSTLAFNDLEEDNETYVDEVDHAYETYDKPAIEVLCDWVGAQLHREVEAVDRE